MPHLDMGRYALFVWPAYAITAAVLAGLVWDSLARSRRWRRETERRQTSAEPRP
jgi:heme exporter protein D